MNMFYQVYWQFSLWNHVSTTFSIHLVQPISYSISNSSSFYLTLTVLIHLSSILFYLFISINTRYFCTVLIFWNPSPLPCGRSVPPGWSTAVFQPNDVNNSSRWLFMWRSCKVTASGGPHTHSKAESKPPKGEIEIGLGCTSSANRC